MPFNVNDANNQPIAMGFLTQEDAQAFIDSHASDQGLTVQQVADAPAPEALTGQAAVDAQVAALGTDIDTLLSHVNAVETELQAAQNLQAAQPEEPVDLTKTVDALQALRDKLEAAK